MDYIVLELKRQNIEFFRLNTESLPESLATMSSTVRDDWSISIDGKRLHGGQVTGAYFRRPGRPTAPESVTDATVRNYVESEWGSFLKSLYMRLEGKWLNSPTNIILAEDKPRQLLIANDIGFSVPNAQITNNLQSAREVADSHQTIGKPLREALLSGESESVMFTTRLKTLTEADRASLALAPIIVQQEIIKKFDIRVTVVGQEIFAAAIWSQANPETEVDWRHGSRTDLKHELIDLPADLTHKCIEITQTLGLTFGAIDLICDSNDKFWFLEINPNGQWAWIENLTGAPITKAIVKELQGIS
jgi:glutathione synthase/RimK-type ligase-like ATP-grasp enzyme